MNSAYLTSEQERQRNCRRALLVFVSSLAAVAALSLLYAWVLYPPQPGRIRAVAEQLAIVAMLAGVVTAAAAIGYVVTNRLSSISRETIRYGAGIVSGLVALLIIFVLVVNLHFALGISP